MSNIDKAVQVIYDEVNQTWERGEILTTAGEAERLANALADAGLLAPDPTELRNDHIITQVSVRSARVSRDDYCVRYDGAGALVDTWERQVMLTIGGNDEVSVYMTINQARDLAVALFAEANYGEKA